MVKHFFSAIILVSAALFAFGIAGFAGNVVFHADSITVARLMVAQAGSIVGMQVSVPANPDNTLAQQLGAKERILSEREALLAEKEKGLGGPGSGDRSTLLYYMAGTGVMLAGLVGLHRSLGYHTTHAGAH
jgi:hypothetical protein